MAIGDLTSYTITNYGKKIIMELGTLNGGNVKLVANFNVTGGAGVSKNFVVNFGAYQTGKGVAITSVTIPDLPVNAKLISYSIQDNANNSVLFPITLDPAEQIAFPDGGILYIAELAIDVY